MVVRQDRIVMYSAWLLLVMLLSACDALSAGPVNTRFPPAFSLYTLDDKPVNFPQQYHNQVVLISFWADWCPLCKKEMHDFEGLYQKYKDRGLSVLAINIAQDKATAQAFISDLDLSYDVLLDTDGETANEYKISSLPSALIINRQGRIQTRILGETALETFEQIITSLL